MSKEISDFAESLELTEELILEMLSSPKTEMNEIFGKDEEGGKYPSKKILKEFQFSGILENGQEFGLYYKQCNSDKYEKISGQDYNFSRFEVRIFNSKKDEINGFLAVEEGKFTGVPMEFSFFKNPENPEHTRDIEGVSPEDISSDHVGLYLEGKEAVLKAIAKQNMEIEKMTQTSVASATALSKNRIKKEISE